MIFHLYPGRGLFFYWKLPLFSLTLYPQSAEIAGLLNISIHTVSRHRQEIISKLQVKNTHEACRLAKSMGLI
ncbi:MAG: LuxR C-terminal-related transcriptional regulator [Muribaculaceae bacterium]|nr:LuxR C-terminal-related transcriptional regulator [Muribaculaceae bacterium]